MGAVPRAGRSGRSGRSQLRVTAIQPPPPPPPPAMAPPPLPRAPPPGRGALRVLLAGCARRHLRGARGGAPRACAAASRGPGARWRRRGGRGGGGTAAADAAVPGAYSPRPHAQRTPRVRRGAPRYEDAAPALRARSDGHAFRQAARHRKYSPARARLGRAPGLLRSRLQSCRRRRLRSALSGPPRPWLSAGPGPPRRGAPSRHRLREGSPAADPLPGRGLSLRPRVPSVCPPHGCVQPRQFPALLTPSHPAAPGSRAGCGEREKRCWKEAVGWDEDGCGVRENLAVPQGAVAALLCLHLLLPCVKHRLGEMETNNDPVGCTS